MECRILDIADYCLYNKRLASKSGNSAAGITLSVNAGEIALIVGLDDVGKSRLLAAAAGIVPSHGAINISGTAAGSSKAKQLVGYVPDIESLYPELTCIQYLSTFAEIYGVERHYRPYIMREALALVHLDGFEDTVIGSIADEYRRRCLCIARALVHDPRLLVIDEVFAHIDNVHTKPFLDILNNIRRRGKALLLSGSQLGYFYDLADQVCYLEDGIPFWQGRLPDAAAELSDYHMYQLQTLNETLKVSASSFMRGFAGCAQVISLRHNVKDKTLWRVIFHGTPEEFGAYLQQMHSCGMQVVSCWEDQAFFGQMI